MGDHEPFPRGQAAPSAQLSLGKLAPECGMGHMVDVAHCSMLVIPCTVVVGLAQSVGRAYRTSDRKLVASHNAWWHIRNPSIWEAEEDLKSKAIVENIVNSSLA